MGRPDNLLYRHVVLNPDNVGRDWLADGRVDKPEGPENGSPFDKDEVVVAVKLWLLQTALSDVQSHPDPERHMIPDPGRHMIPDVLCNDAVSGSNDIDEETVEPEPILAAVGFVDGICAGLADVKRVSPCCGEILPVDGAKGDAFPVIAAIVATEDDGEMLVRVASEGATQQTDFALFPPPQIVAVQACAGGADGKLDAYAVA